VEWIAGELDNAWVFEVVVWHELPSEDGLDAEIAVSVL
jgi:hypothetical protein